MHRGKNLAGDRRSVGSSLFSGVARKSKKKTTRVECWSVPTGWLHGPKVSGWNGIAEMSVRMMRTDCSDWRLVVGV